MGHTMVSALYANGQKIYVYGKNVLRACLPPPLGYIHVYDHNIQTSSSLKAKLYVEHR